MSKGKYIMLSYAPKHDLFYLLTELARLALEIMLHCDQLCCSAKFKTRKSLPVISLHTSPLLLTFYESARVMLDATQANENK